jgi:hypothetical protein
MTRRAGPVATLAVRRAGGALMRAGLYCAMAGLLCGCVPLGVRVQNMYTALLG